jgi:hypothetical protein
MQQSIMVLNVTLLEIETEEEKNRLFQNAPGAGTCVVAFFSQWHNVLA